MRRTIVRRLLAVATAALVGMFLQAMPALGADTFTPSSVNVTLQAGASTTVHKTLHLDALPARADIVVAIDTTASMCGAIAQAKAQANCAGEQHQHGVRARNDRPVRARRLQGLPGQPVRRRR